MLACQLNDRIFAVSSGETDKFEKTLLLLNLPDMDATCLHILNTIRKQSKRLFHEVTKTTVFRIGMQSVKHSIEFYAVPQNETRLDFVCNSFIVQT